MRGKQKRPCDIWPVCNEKKYKYERYPSLGLVSGEIWYYKKLLRGLNIYCPCDFIYNNDNIAQEYQNNIFSYLETMMVEWGIESLTYTQYNPIRSGRITRIVNDNGVVRKTVKSLNGYGEFLSDECQSELNECDIVIACPRYDMFNSFMESVDRSGKNYLVLGDDRKITEKEIFPIVKRSNLWYGINKGKDNFFEIPLTLAKTIQDDRSGFVHRYDEVYSIQHLHWMTNVKHQRYQEDFDSYKSYAGNESEFSTCMNLDNMINVNSIWNIPMDFGGYMAVPHTFMTVYTPRQFEIVGCLDIHDVPKEWRQIGESIFGEYRDNGGTSHISAGSSDAIYRNSNGELELHYKRILIRHRKIV